MLDGVGVEASDLSAAKSKYAGTALREHLEEKIGRRFFNNVRVLDLSAARIREIGDVFTTGSAAARRRRGVEPGVERVDARVDGVRALPRLKTLRLSGNRVENNALWSPEALRAALRAKNTRVSEERPGAGCFAPSRTSRRRMTTRRSPSAIRRFRRSARSTCDPTACLRSLRSA